MMTANSVLECAARTVSPAAPLVCQSLSSSVDIRPRFCFSSEQSLSAVHSNLQGPELPMACLPFSLSNSMHCDPKWPLGKRKNILGLKSFAAHSSVGHLTILVGGGPRERTKSPTHPIP